MTCYSIGSLKLIAKNYNKEYGKKIDYQKKSKSELFECLMKIEESLFTEVPKGEYSKITDTDIQFVFDQFTKLDKTFQFLGTIELSTFNFRELKPITEKTAILFKSNKSRNALFIDSGKLIIYFYGHQIPSKLKNWAKKGNYKIIIEVPDFSTSSEFLKKSDTKIQPVYFIQELIN